MKDLRRTLVLVIIITIQVPPCLITGQSVEAPTEAVPVVTPGSTDGGTGSDQTTTGVYDVTSHVTNSRETNTTLLQTGPLAIMTLPRENGSSTDKPVIFSLTNSSIDPDLNRTAKTQMTVTSDSVENISLSYLHDANHTTRVDVTGHVTNSRENDTTPLQTDLPDVTLSSENSTFEFLFAPTEPSVNSAAKSRYTSENVSVYQITGNSTDGFTRHSSVIRTGNESHSTVTLHDLNPITVATTGSYKATRDSKTNTTQQLQTGLIDLTTLPRENTTFDYPSFSFTNISTDPSMNSTAKPQNTSGSTENTTAVTVTPTYGRVTNKTTFDYPSFSFINTSTEPSMNSTANPQYTSVPIENTSASDQMTAIVTSTYGPIINSSLTGTSADTVNMYGINSTTVKTATMLPKITDRSQTDGIVTTLPFTGNPDPEEPPPAAGENTATTVRSDVSSVSIYDSDLGITHNQNNVTSHTSQNAVTTAEHSVGISQTTRTMKSSEEVHKNTTATGHAGYHSTSAMESISVDTHPSTLAHTQPHPSISSNTQPSTSPTTPLFNIVASPSVIYIGDWQKPSTHHTAPTNGTNPNTTTPSVASQSQLIEHNTQHSTLTTLLKGVTSHKPFTHHEGSSLPTLPTLSNTSPQTMLDPLQRTSSGAEAMDSPTHTIHSTGTLTTLEALQTTPSMEQHVGTATSSTTLSVSSSIEETVHSTSFSGDALVTPTLTTTSTRTQSQEEQMGTTTQSTPLAASIKETIHSTVSGEAPVTQTMLTKSTSASVMPSVPVTNTPTQGKPIETTTASAQPTLFTLSQPLTLPPSTTLPSSTPIQTTTVQAQPVLSTAQVTTLAATTMGTTTKATTAAPTVAPTTPVATTTTKPTTTVPTTPPPPPPTPARVTTVKVTTKKKTARPKVTSNTTIVTTTTTPAPPYLVEAPPRTAYLVPDLVPSAIMVSISSIIVFDKPWHRDLTRAWSREYKTFTGAFDMTMLAHFESVRNSGFDSLTVDQLNSMTVQTSDSSTEEYTSVAYTVQYGYNQLMTSGGVEKVLRRTGIPAAVRDGSLDVDGFHPVGNTDLIFTSQAVVDKEALDQLVQYDNPCQYYECDSGFSCHQEGETTKFSCISRCLVNYCLTRGFCTHLLEGRPTCKCDSNSGGWYTGERCDYYISHVAAVLVAVGVQAFLLACIIFKKRKDSPYLLPVRIAPEASYARSVHALGKR
ncbi:uncharacterized protein LOC144927777 [Branchiostoma floridae x Branchiostoma belcheri]